MAQIDTGAGGSGRREQNRELPLVPFIDFLLCLVSFLLITAVWTQSARLAATANVPGQNDCKDEKCREEKPKRLHVEIRENKFQLVWKQGSTVIASADVARKPVKTADGTVRYPDLEQRLAEEWKSQGAHRDASDPKMDQAVLHSENRAEFGELVAVIDALSKQQRTRDIGGTRVSIPAFSVTFAAN
jgi:biopolymer transport protein ExbD